ncbi:type II secretion system protein [Ferrimonas balearica]|uniref:type II secretion system protein n=1 Tax=Ferrimonas balearica TaxID=44012 RepID=UPI001C58794F|nr:type II secretion system protein [Ferrimonas balearica]MBW3140969.1 type II secretion system GspH family protein [Ferrimonas balearica]MBW3165831.1 type II secretion system GspH family protein [Ferrimonas balearica]MBY6108007.1 type II secretion system GspH family protein [Ferrimonas balearica]
MKRQQGFTLIELVVVIIILGILAVTAAPKFINLQKDARVATLSGAKGAIQGANALVYSKAAIAGKETTASVPDFDIGNGESVTLVYGYMGADSVDSAVELDSTEWTVTTGADANAGKAAITPVGFTADFAQDGSADSNDACQVIYQQATDANAPIITIVDGKC